jgi:hypothetical protein
MGIITFVAFHGFDDFPIVGGLRLIVKNII